MSLFKNRPLALVFAAFLFGSLITLWLNASGVSPFGVIAPLLSLFLVVLILALLKRLPRLIPVVAFFLVAASVSQAVYDDRRFSDIRNADIAMSHTITATVTDIDDKERSYGLYTVRVSNFNGEISDLYLQLRVDPEVRPTALALGDDISADIIITKTAGSDRYYYSRGIAGYAVAEKIVAIKTTEGRSPSLRLRSLSLSLSRRLRAAVGGEEAALLSALFLGNREGLSPSTTLAFRRAGLSHTLALSGMHLSVLAALLLRIFRWLRLPRKVSTPIFLAILAFYTALAGAPLSLLRSAGMLAIARIGALVRRAPDPVTSLFTAVAVIVSVSPGAAADLGLWLSFLATLGLLVANEAFPLAGKKRAALPRKLLRALVFSLFVLGFTLLLSVLAFRAFSLLAPISTLIVSPLIQALLTLAPLTLLFASPNAFTNGVAFLAKITLDFVEWLSSFPVYVSPQYPFFIFTLVGFSAFVILLLVLPLKSRAVFVKSFSAALTALTISFVACHIYGHYRDFVLCVKHYENDYLVVKDDGRVTVIDTGSNEHSLHALTAALAKESVTEIDTLIVTADRDNLPLYLSAADAQLCVREVIFLCNERNADAVALSMALAKDLSLPCRAENADFIFKEEGLTIRILSGLYTQHRKKPELLVHVAFKDESVLYASANILSLFDAAVLSSYFSDVDCVILGAYPGRFGHRVISPFPEKALTVTAYPELLLPPKGGAFPTLEEHFLFPIE